MKRLVILLVSKLILSAPLLANVKDLSKVRGFSSYNGSDLLYFPKYHKAYNRMEELEKEGIPLKADELECPLASGLRVFGFNDALVLEKAGYDYLTIFSRDTLIQLNCNLSVIQ